MNRDYNSCMWVSELVRANRADENASRESAIFNSSDNRPILAGYRANVKAPRKSRLTRGGYQ